MPTPLTPITTITDGFVPSFSREFSSVSLEAIISLARRTCDGYFLSFNLFSELVYYHKRCIHPHIDVIKISSTLQKLLIHFTKGYKYFIDSFALWSPGSFFKPSLSLPKTNLRIFWRCLIYINVFFVNYTFFSGFIKCFFLLFCSFFFPQLNHLSFAIQYSFHYLIYVLLYVIQRSSLYRYPFAAIPP